MNLSVTKGLLPLNRKTPSLTHKTSFNEKDTIDTMRQIEAAYWRYLDHDHQKSPLEYPYMRLHEFASRTLREAGYNHVNSGQYCRLYEKYKKTLPTAGCLIYHQDKMVVVRIRNSPIMSMPKGKKDDTDPDLLATAIRETREETGLDFEDTVTSSTTQVKLQRTLFYVVECDSELTFTGFNENEIEDVRWIPIADIEKDPLSYSKQTQAAAAYLRNIMPIKIVNSRAKEIKPE